MNSTLVQFAHAVNDSALHQNVVHWLRTVPGLPPIVQTVHIVSIACVMASIVFIDLRVLGLAAPSQNAGEMSRRLMPWMWTALVLLLLSGSMFVIATPRRYFSNPIFGFKLALLLPAIVLAWALSRLIVRNEKAVATKLVAGVSLLLWLGVVLAGRWIAYIDYIFPPE